MIDINPSSLTNVLLETIVLLKIAEDKYALGDISKEDFEKTIKLAVDSTATVITGTCGTNDNTWDIAIKETFK